MTLTARHTDPLPSHIAANTAERTRVRVKNAVMLLALQEEELTGHTVCDLYELRATRSGWPAVHFESPRKRLEELAKDGALIITNPDDPRGTPRIYRIPKEQNQ